jgi:subtilase family serine protease
MLLCGSAVAEPLHVLVPHRFAQPPTTADCEAAFQIACYSPNQFQRAYDMQPLYKAGLNGNGKTIVLVDSFGSPTIQADLQTFDQQFGLPDPPHFDIITPAGTPPPFAPGDTADNMVGWAEETSLDVEYSHAMAPGANILLVETPTAETEGTVGFPDIVAAENYVINHNLGDVISQSFGASEPTFPSARSIFNLRSGLLQRARPSRHRARLVGRCRPHRPEHGSDGLLPVPDRQLALQRSAGDIGRRHPDAPRRNGNRLAPDNVWNDTFNPNVTGPTPSPAASGGGRSAVFGRPFYQNGVADVTHGARGTPDISMSAAVDGAALVYLGFPGIPPGFYLIGGTSEASPLFAGVVAVADQAAHRRLGLLNPTLYALGDGDAPASTTSSAATPRSSSQTPLRTRERSR